MLLDLRSMWEGVAVVTPGTSWTECTLAATTFVECSETAVTWGEFVITGDINGVNVLFGVLIPQTGTLQSLSANADWTECTAPPSTWTERTN